MTTSSSYFGPKKYSLKPKYKYVSLFNADHFSFVLPMEIRKGFTKIEEFGNLNISLSIPGCRPEESLLALLVECWSKSRFLQLCFLATASYWNVCKKREKENQRDRPWRLGSVNFTTRVQNLTVTKPIRLELKSLEKLVNLIRLVRLTVCWQADIDKTCRFK